MNEIETRRLFITDEEWNRTSPSWKDLRPLRNFESFSTNDESVTQCTERLNNNGYQVPHSVIEQWIYPHYYKRNVVNNYGWLDYRNISFIETRLHINEIKNINVIKEYQRYVKNRSEYKSFDDFACITKDKYHWKHYNTWRIPPIAIDVTALSNIPSYSELSKPYQLVEGHTRLGYLLALQKIEKQTLQEHTLFVMQAK